MCDCYSIFDDLLSTFESYDMDGKMSFEEHHLNQSQEVEEHYYYYYLILLLSFEPITRSYRGQ